MKINPYEVLGVKPDASDEDIKRVHRKLAVRCHPDFFPGDKAKEEEFKTLTVAYEMIDTEEKRRSLRQRAGVILTKGVSGAVINFFEKLYKIKEER